MPYPTTHPSHWSTNHQPGGIRLGAGLAMPLALAFRTQGSKKESDEEIDKSNLEFRNRGDNRIGAQTK